MSPRAKKTSRAKKRVDPLRDDFGPGVAEVEPEPEPESEARAVPGIACAGEGCFLKPVADLLSKFAFRMVKGHGPSLGRAASSGLEMMKAMRDFLDEEIAMAERAAKPGAPRVTKIPVE